MEETKELEVVKRSSAAVARKVTDLEIKSNDDLTAATDILSQVKTAQKNLKLEKEKILGPQLEAVQATRNLFAPYEKQLLEAETDIKGKMISYESEIDRAAKAEEARIQAQLDKGRIKPETAAKKIDNIATGAPQVTGAKGVVQFRIQKKIVIENASLLPREYLVPNEVLIRKAALAGVQIPGVKVVEEKIIAAR